MRTEYLIMLGLIAVLILFAAIILQSLAGAAGVRVRREMKQLLRSYDSIIDKKALEVEKLDLRKQDLQKQISSLTGDGEEVSETSGMVTGEGAAVMGSAAIPPMASYRSSVLGSAYESIHSSFQMNAAERSQIIEEALEDDAGADLRRGDQAEHLLEALGFDTVFQLSRLPADDQLEILDETLSDRDWTLLRDYVEDHEDLPFSITAFWDWLKDIARLESSEVEVLCGDALASRQEGLTYQKQICEGIQIRMGNRIYDYSITEKEIN